MLGPNERLEYYIAQSQDAHGASAAALCMRATSDPHLHVFGELLDSPSIAVLAQGPHAAEYRLLCLFARGTYQQWQANKSAYPVLSDAHIFKLRTLTLLSVSAGKSFLSFDQLMQALGLLSKQDLEHFALHAASTGLVTLRVDQRLQRIHVSSLSGRDLTDQASIETMQNALLRWKAASERLLVEIDAKINVLTSRPAQ